MAKRGITIKGFIGKATSTRLKPAVFLSQYRDFLSSGEIANITDSILAKLDNNEITAEVGLQNITEAVFNHMLQTVAVQVKQSSIRNNIQSSNGNYVLKLFDSKNRVIANDSFSLNQDAERTGERWLVNSEPGSYAKIESLKLKDRKGQPFITTISRDDAFANFYKRKKTPIMKTRSIGSGNQLGFGVRVKQDHSHFSHG